MARASLYLNYAWGVNGPVRSGFSPEVGAGARGSSPETENGFRVSGEDPRVTATQEQEREQTPESAQARASDRACAAEPKP